MFLTMFLRSLYTVISQFIPDNFRWVVIIQDRDSGVIGSVMRVENETTLHSLLEQANDADYEETFEMLAQSSAPLPTEGGGEERDETKQVLRSWEPSKKEKRRAQ